MPSAQAPTLEVPLLPGIRQDVDPNVAPVGTLVEATNVRFRRHGVVQPRQGTRDVISNTVAGAGGGADNSMPVAGAGAYSGFAGSRGDVPVLGVNGKAYAWDGSTQFLFQGAYSTAQPLKRRNGLATEKNSGFAVPGYRSAVAVIGSTLLFAGSDGVVVCWRVESADGVVLAAGDSSGTVCSAVVQGTVYYLVIQDGASLWALPLTVSGSTVTEGTLTNIATLSSATGG